MCWKTQRYNKGMIMTVIKLTTLEEFEKAIQDEQAFIKVSTTTCAPCKMMNPLFDKIAEEADGTFYSVEVDTADANLSEYAKDTLSITTVPTFFRFSKGVPDKRVSGAFPKTQLVSKLDITL